MAQLTGDIRDFGEEQPDPGSAVHYAPATAKQQETLLSMLLTGTMTATAAASRFRAFATEQNYVLENLWGAWRGRSCLAAALVVPCPGRTGLLFISPQGDTDTAQPTTELVRRVIDSLDPGQINLAQILLDPAQTREAAMIEDAGGRRLAQLLYLRRKTERQKVDALPADLRMLSWTQARRRLFAQAIEASYEKTLDCPGLVGMRQIDDVIEGHMAAGQFQHERWRVITDGGGGQGLGVLLLNGVPNRPALELVYLGLSPALRGQGMGRRLVKLALDTAARERRRELILAVDQSNTPALALYQSMGFITSARKLALVFALSAKRKNDDRLSTSSPDRRGNRG